MEQYLQHHGIKGQKWGVRRYQNEDGTLTNLGKRKIRNENYSDKQFKEDSNMYSKGAAKRINSKMNDGLGVRGARSSEADRINATRKTAKTMGQVGKVVGGVGGAIGGYYLSNKVMDFAARKGLAAGNDPAVRVLTYSSIMAGSAKVGTLLGKMGGESVTMLAGGYKPSKYRE